MGIIGIEIPDLNEEQEIEVQVTVNGQKQTYNYKVEFFYWDNCPDSNLLNKVECLKTIVSDYPNDWQLTQIGLPTETYIPITFRRKS